VVSSTFWLAIWIAVSGVGALGVVASANSLRFGRRVAREVREMWAIEPSGAPARIEELPGPVRRYLGKAAGDRRVRTVRLRHGGTFRTKLDGGWLPVRGEQYFSADPPGFVWWGRIRMIPGLWFDVRDQSVGGVGRMFATVESTFTLADGAGAAFDQGSLLRLLGEMVWFPSAFLDARHVIWGAIDDQHARAMLRVGGREVCAVFEFRADGLPATVSADRYRDVDGRAVLTPWSGELSEYRDEAGMLVPHKLVPYWHIDGKRIPYAQWEMERLEYDSTAPY
jgi:hypothetical protein